MTLTVKLDAVLEEDLRKRAQATGRSTSDVVRAALQAYLAQEEAGPSRSAFELGADVFGRHRGDAELAARRKGELAEIWAERHRTRT